MPKCKQLGCSPKTQRCDGFSSIFSLSSIILQQFLPDLLCCAGLCWFNTEAWLYVLLENLRCQKNGAHWDIDCVCKMAKIDFKMFVNSFLFLFFFTSTSDQLNFHLYLPVLIFELRLFWPIFSQNIISLSPVNSYMLFLRLPFSLF